MQTNTSIASPHMWLYECAFMTAYISVPAIPIEHFERACKHFRMKKKKTISADFCKIDKRQASNPRNQLKKSLIKLNRNQINRKPLVYVSTYVHSKIP